MRFIDGHEHKRALDRRIDLKSSILFSMIYERIDSAPRTCVIDDVLPIPITGWWRSECPAITPM